MCLAQPYGSVAHLITLYAPSSVAAFFVIALATAIDNGGVIKTRHLGMCSRAIDAVTADTCPSLTEARAVSEGHKRAIMMALPSATPARLSGASLYDDTERDICHGSAGTDSVIACEQNT